MIPPLTARIAFRYLFSKKSHSAVSAISAVSVAGVAVATAALVCVLSVFNGFRDVLSVRLDTLGCDVAVTPVHGKTIGDADSLLTAIRSLSGVERAMPVVSDNALAVYDAREMPVRVKGVDESLFRQMTAIDSLIIPEGRFAASSTLTESAEDEYGESEEIRSSVGTIAVGVASRLSIYDLDRRLLLFTPRKGVRVNPANPLASFITDSISVAGVYQANQSDYDDNIVLTDLPTARHLFELDDHSATAIEVKARKGVEASSLAADIRGIAGKDFVVKDSLQQQELHFRMIEIEKWVTFLLLFFILLIAGFNLISTLSMLVLEKRKALGTLKAIGMTSRSIGGIFAWESAIVTLIGGVAGMLLGVVLCLLQENFGLIRLNGDADSLVIKAYPVALQWTDLLLVCIPLAAVGIITAIISSGFARRRASL